MIFFSFINKKSLKLSIILILKIMEENKRVGAFLVVLSAFIIIMSFVLNFAINLKIILAATGISLSTNYFIINKKVRYLIAGICLCVILYIALKRY